MPQDRTITEQAGKILEVIKHHEGEWINRKAIALELGKKGLSAADLVYLQYLEEQGLIEAISVPTRAPSGQRAEYRVKP